MYSLHNRGMSFRIWLEYVIAFSIAKSFVMHSNDTSETCFNTQAEDDVVVAAWGGAITSLKIQFSHNGVTAHFFRKCNISVPEGRSCEKHFNILQNSVINFVESLTEIPFRQVGPFNVVFICLMWYGEYVNDTMVDITTLSWCMEIALSGNHARHNETCQQYHNQNW